LKGPLPEAVRNLERSAAAAVVPLLETLAHRNLVYAGEPYLFAAFSAFARELGLRVPAAIMDTFPRPLGTAGLPSTLLFAPDTRDALTALEGLTGYRKPDLVVGNSFARTEGFARNLPFTELGFPSYGHHCIGDEPFLGFSGAKTLAGRLFNSLRAGSYTE
ncbi:MAG TPA: nitrogenase component 1, partial [Elusimicrobiales bacterium]|nr:nitrogenase component 1 [Elusimicrobiales bacterium]